RRRRRLATRDALVVAQLLRRSASMATNRWTDEYLDAMRNHGDPEGDAVVTTLLAGGEGEVWTANQLFQTLSANDAVVPEALPAPVREYFQRTELLPAWADPELIR